MILAHCIWIWNFSFEVSVYSVIFICVSVQAAVLIAEPYLADIISDHLMVATEW